MICLMGVSKVPGDMHTLCPVAFPLCPLARFGVSDEWSSPARLSFIMGGRMVVYDLLASFSPPSNRFRHSPSRPSHIYDPN